MQDEPRPLPPQRLSSIDAYRGFVMFLMMAEVLHLCGVAAAHPKSEFWKFLCYHQSHVEWVGCSLHDMIQPSFSFLVGVALPFSIAGRLGRGQSRARMTLHSIWRSLVLVFLGVFLRSRHSSQTNFTFEDTLSQIGLGYTFLFVLGLRPVRDQWLALVAILVGYWAWFALHPLPGPDWDGAAAGVPKGWSHSLAGFAAHWNLNSNPAWAFDRWFLNLFPRKSPFLYNPGGYSTLSFIPTLATMILGLLAGGVLKSDRTVLRKGFWLVVAALAGLLLGAALDLAGVCPIVKKIWTPSWVLFSGGWCFLILAALYLVMDAGGWKGWAFPLVVIGMNSIAAYCMSGLLKEFITSNLKIHLGPGAFRVFGPVYENLVQGAAVLFALWLVLFWMYKRRIFLRI